MPGSCAMPTPAVSPTCRHHGNLVVLPRHLGRHPLLRPKKAKEEQLHGLSAYARQYHTLPKNDMPEEDRLNAYRTEKLFLNHVQHGDVEKVKSILSSTKKVRSGKMSDDTVTQRLFDMIFHNPTLPLMVTPEKRTTRT